MAKRFKQITSGRLVYSACYTVASRRETGQVRAEKSRMSSAAQDRLNLRRSWEKLEQVLAGNFTGRDLHVTLTYRDKDLPASRAEAIKRLRKVIKDLRSQRRARGQPTKYLYVTEGFHGDGRLHHHLVINGTGEDFEAIRALWLWGDDIQFDHLDEDSYEALAKYLTKEPREYGNVEVGARTWTPSLGLVKPKTETADVPDTVTLAASPGAIILDRREDRNEFGEFIYLKYYLPRPRPAPNPRYQRPKPNRGSFNFLT